MRGRSTIHDTILEFSNSQLANRNVLHDVTYKNETRSKNYYVPVALTSHFRSIAFNYAEVSIL